MSGHTPWAKIRHKALERRLGRTGGGFRFLLALEGGEPFTASGGQRFRILAIEPEIDEERVVEPVASEAG